MLDPFVQRYILFGKSMQIPGITCHQAAQPMTKRGVLVTNILILRANTTPLFKTVLDNRKVVLSFYFGNRFPQKS